MKTNRFFPRKTVAFLWYTLVALVLFPQVLVAQTTYRTAPGNAGILNVTGTSDLQDWSMSSAKTVSQGELAFNEKNELISVSAFSFSVKAASLKGNVKAMDRKARKALNTKKHPYILFTLHNAAVSLGKDNKYQINGNGGLTVNGITQTISLQLYATVNPDQTVTISGTKALKFSDFLIPLPNFMRVMQAGNDIAVDLSLNYAPVPKPQVVAK